ncbi:MAG: hypothetical protein AAGI66_06405 [Cyanobacteria bacterium P01_H01_bin.74]
MLLAAFSVDAALAKGNFFGKLAQGIFGVKDIPIQAPPNNPFNNSGGPPFFV